MKEYLFIRRKREFFRLAFSDIIYVESLKNYIQIVTAKNKFMVKTTLSSVEKLLPRNQFCRIHRGYIVALTAVTGFNLNKVHLQQKDLPLSEQYRKVLLNCIITLEDQSSEKHSHSPEDIDGLVANTGLN
jgi:DNA-binding LytR/AlgR family response regulator